MPTPRMRAGHTDRQSAVDRLTRHFTEGRLDPTEFEERVGKAYAATHLDELPELTADLPEHQPRADRSANPWAGPRRPPSRRPPLVVGIMVAVALVMSIGAITLGFFPFPIFWVLLVAFLVTTGRRRRRYGYPHQLACRR